MHKIILCASLLLSSININDPRNISVKKIEYNEKNRNDEFIELKIDLYSSSEDILLMQVYFCDKEKVCDKEYYSSSLIIKGEKSTTAKIPFKVEDDSNLNILFYSNNLKDYFENIMFPIYSKNNQICYLSESYECSGKKPSIIKYENKVIEEKYDKLSLVNKEKVYYLFDNRLPIEKIRIGSVLENNNGYANLYIEDKVKGMEIYYNDGYVIPLNIEFKNNIINLTFSNKYYLDLKNGFTYEEYEEKLIYTSQIVFPYIDEEYDVKIELVNVFSSFEKVILGFKFVTKGELFGRCDSSKYCLRRKYL